MRRSLIAAISFTCLSFLNPSPADASCGAEEVCSDVADSFAGHVEQEGVRVHWETDSESVAVASYVLRRLGCAQCPMVIWAPQATGTCGTAKLYEMVDEDPPENTSGYELRVVKLNGQLACIETIEPSEP